MDISDTAKSYKKPPNRSKHSIPTMAFEILRLEKDILAGQRAFLNAFKYLETSTPNNISLKFGES